ncbi:hypothetical protein BsWGS_23968 [Bradybaena similaris]
MSTVETSSTTTTTTTTKIARTTNHPLSACESMRQSSRTMRGKYVPRCLPNGDFDSLQCHGLPGTSDCWCSDLGGREIAATLMEPPNYPSCDNGGNLPPCVYQLVKHLRSKVLGSFRPDCAVDGQFNQIQCHGSICFCVQESTGQKIAGSEVHNPDQPNCDVTGHLPDPGPVDVTTRKTKPAKDSTQGHIDIDGDDYGRSTPKGMGSDENVDKGQESNKDDKKLKDDSKTGADSSVVNRKPGQDGLHENKVENASEIMTQPGILAGIIGGSVVLLLCVVLLVMFVVYRMRKKDEGSYPLDEPRKTPNYNYVRAPEKEFYA